MKKLILTLFFILSLFMSYAQTKYPIKTIFRGDSVIILTIQQSDKINEMLEKSSKVVKENNKKNQEYENEIFKLKQIIAEQNSYIDSLSNVLLECWSQGYELPDSLWKWALGPSIVYTQYPDDSTVYIMDLSHYYMTTDDFGITMIRMSNREYRKYQDFISRYGLSEEAFWQFRNEMKIKYLKDSEVKERKVWKFKKQWNREIKE